MSSRIPTTQRIVASCTAEITAALDVIQASLGDIDTALAGDVISTLYSKANPGKLWVDLGGEVDWEDILSREGVHQGCSFRSFLSSLGLQPVLREAAAGMLICVASLLPFVTM